MVTVTSLWLPILLSAVAVWIASFIVWVLLPHHKSDYKALPDEEAALNALRPQNLAPGMYNIPHLECQADMKKPEVVKKFDDGPAGFFTVVPRGVPKMAGKMVVVFVYYLIVGCIVAYLAGRTLAPQAHYLTVFRVTGCAAWLAYGFAIVPEAIWFGRPWSAVFKHLIDALIYALLTAGFFGWLWPH